MGKIKFLSLLFFALLVIFGGLFFSAKNQNADIKVTDFVSQDLPTPVPIPAPVMIKGAIATAVTKTHEEVAQASVKTPAVPVSNNGEDIRVQFDLWKEKLGRISLTDSEKMNSLQEEMESWIKIHDKNLKGWMEEFPRTAKNDVLRESFLMIQSTIRAAGDPAPLLKAILTQYGQETAEPDGQPEKMEAIKIFALDEYASRAETSSLGDLNGAERDLLPVVLKTALTSPNLAVVRSSVNLLNKIAGSPRKYWPLIRKTRHSDELFAIADLIND